MWSLISLVPAMSAAPLSAALEILQVAAGQLQDLLPVVLGQLPGLVDAGAAWGDGIADTVSNFNLSDLFGTNDNIPNPDDYTSGVDDVIKNSGMPDEKNRKL